MIRAATIALTVVVAAHASGLDAQRLADALRVREGYRGQPGALGEAGPWQIRAVTWAQHMPGIPFARAVQAGPARTCALKHIAWLSAALEARGVPATAFNVAVAWNAGLERYTSGGAPVRAYRYGADVEALYNGAMGQRTENRPAETIRWRRMAFEGITIGGGINRVFMAPMRIVKNGPDRAVAFNFFSPARGRGLPQWRTRLPGAGRARHARPVAFNA